MSNDVRDWTPRAMPERKVLEGLYARLEPLDVERHTSDLYTASTPADADDRFRYLPEVPPADEADFKSWMTTAAKSPDPMFFAVIDRQTGKAAGRQALMRIDASNGCIEIGNIYWGPLISRRPAATEALFLMMAYVFDELGYRRFEWKCNNDNLPSRKAAVRFGFSYEGLFRQHMIVKGLNRDTAWYAMIDDEWPLLKAAYLAWLDPANFDDAGTQRSALSEFMNHRD